MLALRFNTNVLDDMFNVSGLNDLFRTEPVRRAAWAPAVEVYETEDVIQMAVELPGVQPQDVNLTVQNGQLTISGRKNPAIQQGKGNPTVQYSERWYGSFERSFSLPSGIDTDRIQASWDAGILMIQLHKAEHARARRIPITVGNGQQQQAQLGAGEK